MPGHLWKEKAENGDISTLEQTIIHQAAKTAFKTLNLYALVIGVSDYQGVSLNLDYPAKDAKAMAAMLDMSAKKLFELDNRDHVFIYDLTTDKVHNMYPEKNAVKEIIRQIGEKAAPDDILLVFLPAMA